MTSEQILILIKFLLDGNNTILKFSWEHTDGNLHLHFFDGGGNKFHKTFNQSGHVMDWDD